MGYNYRTCFGSDCFQNIIPSSTLRAAPRMTSSISCTVLTLYGSQRFAILTYPSFHFKVSYSPYRSIRECTDLVCSVTVSTFSINFPGHNRKCTHLWAARAPHFFRFQRTRFSALKKPSFISCWVAFGSISFGLYNLHISTEFYKPQLNWGLTNGVVVRDKRGL